MGPQIENGELGLQKGNSKMGHQIGNMKWDPKYGTIVSLKQIGTQVKHYGIPNSKL